MSMFSYNGKMSITWVIDDLVSPNAAKLLELNFFMKNCLRSMLQL
jgi:hypothetical protein